MTNVIWRPFFPAEVVGLVLLAACALSFVAVWRGRRHGPGAWCLLLLRWAGLLGIGWIVMGPSMIPPQTETEPRGDATLLVAVDRSQSMLTEDMMGRSRWSFAVRRWLNPEVLGRLRDQGGLRRMAFDREPSLLEPMPDSGETGEENFGGSTYLMSSLEELVSAPGNPNRILLLSDGHDSMGEPPTLFLQQAADRGVTVDTVTLGGARFQRDIHLSGSLPQPYLMVNEAGVLRVRLLQVNCIGLHTTVRVTHQGETRQVPVRFDETGATTLEFDIQHDEPGAYTYLLQVDAVAGEVEERNNHQTVLVDVIPERFRVLLVEGQPFWDTKFLAQSLRRDDRLELMQVSQIAPGRREILLTRLDRDQGDFPGTLEELGEFDVIILGREVENIAGESWLSLLPTYVRERGGSLLFSRGRAFNPAAIRDAQLLRELQLLEPVRLEDAWRQDIGFHPTPRGLSHAVFSLASGPGETAEMFSELPRLRVGRVSEQIAGTKVLAEFESEGERFPAVVARQTGMGSTAMMLGEGSWQWRMPGVEKRGLSGVHHHFWTNMVRWMQSAGEFRPGADVALNVFPRHAKTGEPVSVSVINRLPDMPPREGWILYPDGTREPLGLPPDRAPDGRQEMQWQAEEAGVYTIRVETPGLSPPRLESLVNIYEENTERLQSSARPEVMRLLAEETGGQVLDPYRPEDYAARLKTFRAARQVDPVPEWTWDQGWILVCIALLFGGEWILRRWWGFE